MEIYRVICKFEPTYRHLSGSEHDAWHFSRGAWRVWDSWDLSDVTRPLAVVTRDVYTLGVLAIRRPRNGTRVNPHKLLKEYQEAKHFYEVGGTLDRIHGDARI